MQLHLIQISIEIPVSIKIQFFTTQWLKSRSLFFVPNWKQTTIDSRYIAIQYNTLLDTAQQLRI